MKLKIKNKELDEKTNLDIWKTFLISGSISYPLELIALILLWHFDYFVFFWILLGCGIISWLLFITKLTKLGMKLGISM